MNDRRYRDKFKVMKVLTSCETFEQLSVAHSMVRAYNVFYNTYSDFLESIHSQQWYIICASYTKQRPNNEH